MERQMRLPLAINDEDVLRRLWEQMPEQSRSDLVEQYALLIARAARDSSHSPQPEEEAAKP